jgi:uncharacterized SAM-binding protein YcdF (DUF218 family)
MPDMPSSLQDIAVALTYPLTLSLWLGLCGIVAAILRWRKTGGALLALAVLWSLLWSLPPVSDGLRGLLERRYSVVDESELPTADAVVVLGGGSQYGWLNRPNVRPEDLESSRLAAGARVWLAGRAPVVILSGGGVRGISEARRMASAIVRLGVPDSVLLLEERSRDTRDNAQFTAELVQPQGVRTILLVTSSLHMPRAALLFREAGFQVVPVPVPERARRSRWHDRWLPSRNALWRSGRAMKEFAALAVARVQSSDQAGAM